MRIAHTADVHIRSLSRHSEYREILKAFTDDCKSQGVDHIFVGGDIFHTKTTGISPEYINFLTWWLDDMSRVAHVHLILGNHDLNLSNLSRQDAVSPIVDAMANPRIHLYKKSGVYQFSPGYNFCVFSCCDEEGWSTVQPVPGEVNIAAFHGPVHGSVTETGWDITEGTTTDFFKDYDLCLLGDIHLPQFLGFKKNKPWIGYPGTPIQQNYAERIEHGYLLWKIKSSQDWDVETRRLPNIKPYVTIDWAGDVDKTLELSKRYPKESRFRIRSQRQLTQDEMHVLSESLKSSWRASEVTYKSEVQIDRQTVSAGTTTLTKSDLRSPGVIYDLFQKFHSNVDSKEVLAAKDYIENTLSSVVAVDDSSRGACWSLRQLTWSNTFAYGEDNKINFDNLRGIVGIFGPNRTGKSSVVGTLMYALFNATDRGSIKNLFVCNVRKQFCTATALIDHSGTLYSIERQTVKTANKRGVVSASTALNLFRVRNDEEVDDLCGEQRNDTEKAIKSLIGTPEDFLLTSLSAQGDASQFISLGSSKRRSILSKFLDLDIFDRMYEVANREVNGYKSQLKNFPDRDWNSEIDLKVKEEITMEQKLLDIAREISEKNHDLELQRLALTRHNVAAVTKSDLDLQQTIVKDSSRKLEEAKQNLMKLEMDLVDLEKKKTTIEEILHESDISSLREQLEAQRALELAIKDLRHAFEREESLVESQKKSLKLLDEVPCGDSFPTCKFIKDAHENKQKHDDQLSRRETAKKSLSEAASALEPLKKSSLQEKIQRQEKAESLSARIKVELSEKFAQKERLATTISTLESSHESSKNRLEDLQTAYKNDENIEVVAIRSNISRLSDVIRELDKQKLSLADNKGRIAENISTLKREKKIRDEILSAMRTQELMATAFSKKGIPLTIMRSQLPAINAEVAKILNGIVDFTIELESDEDTDSLEIYINYGDSRRIIELCSGMEKTMASLALRVAMINVSSLSKSDIFIIDEGFGTLDSAGVESCNRLLSSLKRYFKTIIVITHVDGIKDAADHVIEITKDEKDSKLVC